MPSRLCTLCRSDGENRAEKYIINDEPLRFQNFGPEDNQGVNFKYHISATIGLELGIL